MWAKLAIAICAFLLGVAGAYVALSERIEQTRTSIESMREIVLSHAASTQNVRALEDLNATTNVVGLVVAAQKAGTPPNVLASDLSRYLKARIDSFQKLPPSSDSAYAKGAKAAVSKGEQLLEDIKWAY